MTTRDPARADAQPGEPGAAGPVRLPAIRVRTEPTEVAAFSRETFAAGTGDFVPLTFPFRWFTLPPIRALIVQLSGGEEFLPVHEAQSFVYERSLRTGADYVLDIAIETSETPPRLTLKMTVAALQGEICARLETILRIVRLKGETLS
jgi:hypothetical protein